MCNYLLLRKNFDLILIHKGGTGKTGSFQLAQLFAQLLGLLQNGDIVAAAQVCSLGKNGGEVGILAGPRAKAPSRAGRSEKSILTKDGMSIGMGNSMNIRIKATALSMAATVRL